MLGGVAAVVSLTTLNVSCSTVRARIGRASSSVPDRRSFFGLNRAHAIAGATGPRNTVTPTRQNPEA